MTESGRWMKSWSMAMKRSRLMKTEPALMTGAHWDSVSSG